MVLELLSRLMTGDLPGSSTDFKTFPLPATSPEDMLLPLRYDDGDRFDNGVGSPSCRSNSCHPLAMHTSQNHGVGKLDDKSRGGVRQYG